MVARVLGLGEIEFARERGVASLFEKSELPALRHRSELCSGRRRRELRCIAGYEHIIVVIAVLAIFKRAGVERPVVVVTRRPLRLGIVDRPMLELRKRVSRNAVSIAVVTPGVDVWSKKANR